MRPLAELGGAITLLTRLPGAPLVRGPWPDPGRCVWAYPLVGLLVGGVSGLVLVLVEREGVPPLAASMLALAAAAALTGGLHEDGLADTFDALDGRTPDRRLAILRDSRIGAHGALALVLATLIRAACLAAMPAGRASVALALASVLGRASILVVIARARPARAQGAAAPLGQSPAPRLLIGLALSLAVAVPLDAHWALPVLASGLTGLAVARLSRRRFGGFTGDLLGAAEMLAECAVLLAVTMQ